MLPCNSRQAKQSNLPFWETETIMLDCIWIWFCFNWINKVMMLGEGMFCFKKLAWGEVGKEGGGNWVDLYMISSPLNICPWCTEKCWTILFAYPFDSRYLVCSLLMVGLHPRDLPPSRSCQGVLQWHHASWESVKLWNFGASKHRGFLCSSTNLTTIKVQSSNQSF